MPIHTIFVVYLCQIFRCKTVFIQHRCGARAVWVRLHEDQRKKRRLRSAGNVQNTPKCSTVQPKMETKWLHLKMDSKWGSKCGWAKRIWVYFEMEIKIEWAKRLTQTGPKNSSWFYWKKSVIWMGLIREGKDD